MNYYNEWNPEAAAWLRELIARKLIPYGYVDERSITEIAPADLEGFTQCHFFAGIGGWPLALAYAGWPADRPCWTGSAPCQPFSDAGAKRGFADSRNLAPAFLDLIAECRPPVVFGEQVRSAVQQHWLDFVLIELETEGYACGSAVLPAGGFGAPHERYRIFFGAHNVADDDDSIECHRAGVPRTPGRDEPADSSAIGQLAHQQCDGPQRGLRGRSGEERETVSGSAGCGGAISSVANSDHDRQQSSERRGCGGPPPGTGYDLGRGRPSVRGYTDSHYWADADWIGCRDDKFRPVEPFSFPLVNGVPAGMVRGRIQSLAEQPGAARKMRLEGYGNAIVPQVAAYFIKEFAKCIESN